MAEGLRVVPGHVHHGMLVRLSKTREFPTIIWATTFYLPGVLVVPPAPLAVPLRLGEVAGVLHECSELPARHLIFAQIEVPCDLHTALLHLGLFLVRRIAHLKLACRYPHQLHRDAAAEVQGQHSTQATPCLSLLKIVELLHLFAAGHGRGARYKEPS